MSLTITKENVAKSATMDVSFQEYAGAPGTSNLVTTMHEDGRFEFVYHDRKGNMSQCKMHASQLQSLIAAHLRSPVIRAC